MMTFGILCNGNDFQQWQLDAIRLLVDAGHSCELLIINANRVKEQSFFQKWISYPWRHLLFRIWFRYCIKPAAKREADINTLYPGLPFIRCKTTLKGISEYFDPEDVQKVRSHNLDFILRFGFGIIKGEILNASRYGVWSYHHDDDRKYRGVPTGFWEIMFRDPVNAAILQRLTDKIDSGNILHKAYFGTINHAWQANLDHLLQSSVEWPLQVCRRIESGDLAFLSVENAPESAIYKLPGNFTMLHFILKVAFNKLKFHYRDLCRAEKWMTGIIYQPTEDIVNQGEIQLPEPQWLPVKLEKSQYLADPFGFIHKGHMHVICELYDYRSAKGILVSFVFDVTTMQLLRKEVALEKSYHLAFPYLFEIEGDWYCIPENSIGGNVDMYRYDLNSGKLIFEQTLVKNVQAVDPALFYHEGYWWLFFTDKTATNERLHAWYAESFRGPYRSHNNNPIKVDIRSSRPAGKPFAHQGKLLRPAQDCSLRSGWRVALNHVLLLSPTEFSETLYAVVSPSPKGQYTKGMHTFSVTAGAVIVDAKKECFIWPAFVSRLWLKLGRSAKVS